MVKATVSLHSLFEVLLVFRIYLTMGQNAVMKFATYSRGIVTTATVSYYPVLVLACRLAEKVVKNIVIQTATLKALH